MNKKLLPSLTFFCTRYCSCEALNGCTNFCYGDRSFGVALQITIDIVPSELIGFVVVKKNISRMSFPSVPCFIFAKPIQIPWPCLFP